MVYWRLGLLFILVPLLLYVIKHSSNVGLIRGWVRNLATFQMKFHETKEIGFQPLPVAWKSSILDLVGFQVQHYSSPIYISNIFPFEKMNHFSLVFEWYSHSAHSSEVTGRAFLTHLLQTKHTTPDNSNSVGFTFSPKKSTYTSRKKADFKYKSQDK